MTPFPGQWGKEVGGVGEEGVTGPFLEVLCVCVCLPVYGGEHLPAILAVIMQPQSSLAFWVLSCDPLPLPPISSPGTEVILFCLWPF
jgi:hypothetical protein